MTNGKTDPLSAHYPSDGELAAAATRFVRTDVAWKACRGGDPSTDFFVLRRKAVKAMTAIVAERDAYDERFGIEDDDEREAFQRGAAVLDEAIDGSEG